MPLHSYLAQNSTSAKFFKRFGIRSLRICNKKTTHLESDPAAMHVRHISSPVRPRPPGGVLPCRNRACASLHRRFRPLRAGRSRSPIMMPSTDHLPTCQHRQTQRRVRAGEQQKGEAISRAARAEGGARRRQQAHLICYDHVPRQCEHQRKAEASCGHICCVRRPQPYCRGVEGKILVPQDRQDTWFLVPYSVLP